MSYDEDSAQKGGYSPSYATFRKLVQEEFGATRIDLSEAPTDIVKARSSFQRLYDTDPVFAKLVRLFDPKFDQMLRKLSLPVEFLYFKRVDRVPELLLRMLDGAMTDEEYNEILHGRVVLIRESGVPIIDAENPLPKSLRQYVFPEHEKLLEEIIIREIR